MNLQELHKNISNQEDTPLMPMLFVGHGSPMNAIEDNEFSKVWTSLGKDLPTPRAIVCISAHWETKGTFVTIENYPKTIHDFYGFPDELYRQQYPSPGAPLLAQELIDTIKKTHIEDESHWGIDHGTWTILKYAYPKANIPVIQISIDRNKNAQWHYDLAKELMFLRRKGVLVIGSGNMIHNLRMVKLSGDDFNAEYGYDWAFEINDILKKNLMEDNTRALVEYQSLHKNMNLAIPTPEHYIPMLYILGMKNEGERVEIFNDKVIAASLNMTSFMIG